MPGEAEKAAKLLKMSLKDFFKKYLGVAWWNGEKYGQETFVLSPALVDGETGDLFPQNPQGTCIFYMDDKCVIHDAKPFECQMYWHGEKGGKERHHDVAMAWKDHQDQIETLLGRKLIAPELTVGAMIDAMLGMLGR